MTQPPAPARPRRRTPTKTAAHYFQHMRDVVAATPEYK